jgi:HK97 family phage major capsid protein
MTLRELHEQRSKTIAAMRALTAAPAGEDGDLSAEQAAEFDKAKGELTTLETRIERQTLLDEADRRAQGVTIAGSGDARLDRELGSFSLVRAIASQVPDIAASVDSGRERELSAELQRRSGRAHQGVTVPLAVFEQRIQSANVATSGGFLVPGQFRGDLFVDSLRAKLVTGRLGATVISGLEGAVSIPTRTGLATAQWIAENASLDLSDASFGQLMLTPKTVGTRTELSRALLGQSSPDIEVLVRNDFASVLAEAVDRGALTGSGIGPEPKGLLNVSGIGTFNLATVSWANVLSAVEGIEVASASATGWASNPHVVKVLRSTPTVSGGVEGSFIMMSPDSLAGFPLVSSTLVPNNLGAGSNKSALIFGNWADLIIGYWSTFDLLVNPYESGAYARGNVQVRALLTTDVAVRHPASFTAATDVA